MNRYELDAKPKKPGLVPLEFKIEDGDTVINLEKAYVHRGYFEVGCEWIVRNAPFGDGDTKMWVYPIIDGVVSNQAYKFSPFFKVIKKAEKPAKIDLSPLADRFANSFFSNNSDPVG